EHVWPPPDVPLLPIGLPTAAVAVLLVSGAAILMAVRAAARGSARRAARWIGVTLALAVVYIVLSILGTRDLGFGLHEGIFGSLFGVFFVVVGAIYGITNKEYEGFPLLLMTAGGFVLLAVWALRRFRRAERESAAEGEGVGEPHVGPTIWPLVLALSAIAFVL